MEYKKTHLTEQIKINHIISVHYFEYSKDYSFDGESHDFWELMYVDKGEVMAKADEKVYKLSQGKMIFHKPNEFHNIWANGKVAPNLIVISFECKSKAMEYFKNRIIYISDYEKNLLADIISEARNAFISPLNDPYLYELKINKERNFGSLQLIKLYLEQMLIRIMRRGSTVKARDSITTTIKQSSDDKLLSNTIQYLKDNIYGKISFNDICSEFLQSKTSLKVLFKKRTGFGVMGYYNHLKIEEAKKLIREQSFNFTQISEMLGFSSVHYFSRKFKNMTGMAPSEYALSVKIKAF